MCAPNSGRVCSNYDNRRCSVYADVLAFHARHAGTARTDILIIDERPGAANEEEDAEAIANIVAWEAASLTVVGAAV